MTPNDPRPMDAPGVSLAVPKGRQAVNVERLLTECGWGLRGHERDYRPACARPEVTVKRLKGQNIPLLLGAGRHDIGFAGADWVAETNAEVETLLDLGTDPVRLVVAAPKAIAASWRDLGREVVIATEYVELATRWAKANNVNARVIRTYGATEVFPPEDADLIVDNTATGSTLRAHQLEIIDEVMRSSTRLLARPGLKDSPGFELVEDLILMLKATLAARERVMIECNVAKDALDSVIERLPSMRAPTVSSLWGEAGYAVRVAAPTSDIADLVPELRRLGATDIVVYAIESWRHE